MSLVETYRLCEDQNHTFRIGIEAQSLFPCSHRRCKVSGTSSAPVHVSGGLDYATASPFLCVALKRKKQHQRTQENSDGVAREGRTEKRFVNMGIEKIAGSGEKRLERLEDERRRDLRRLMQE